ncbi:HAMP domain-containing histidine kinase [Candidatus Gracilibacteria bacterium]|nr:HAMP domain-containing histidine kinase [Candidatus Gracilibacteria bacterium]
MKLSKKIILSLLGSIFFIAIVNILSFYIFYSLFFQVYLKENSNTTESITREYVDKIIEKQALDEVDNMFSNIEIKFFELLDKNNGKIKLDNKENIDIIANYLAKAGVNIKYIEEVIPQNYLEKIINDLKDNKTPEYNFFKKLIFSILITNILAILLLILYIYLFSRKIISPIEKTTNLIKDLKIGKDFKYISYKTQDEIGFLVKAINELNVKLYIEGNIKTKLLGDISHELKTPITSIQCYVEGIKDGVIKLDDNVLNSIINEMQRLIKLVNTIMDYEKFENKELKLEKKQEDVRFITEQIIKQFKQKLKITSQKIQTSGVNKKLLTDKDSFTQIVQNIISNFIKYAGNNTILKIEFGVNFIIFKDNGVGINRQELPYIKEKFYQGTNKKTGNIDDRGIGVGLSIISKLVKSQNWTMEIESDENKGFEIKIITKTSH